MLKTFPNLDNVEKYRDGCAKLLDIGMAVCRQGMICQYNYTTCIQIIWTYEQKWRYDSAKGVETGESITAYTGDDDVQQSFNTYTFLLIEFSDDNDVSATIPFLSKRLIYRTWKQTFLWKWFRDGCAKTTATWCRDGSMQARDVIQRLHEKNPFSTSFLSLISVCELYYKIAFEEHSEAKKMM